LPVIISFEKIVLFLVFIFFISITFFFADIPFFWDEVYYIGTAHNILDSNFHSLIPTLEFDRGSFPFYGIYMAVWWAVFGKSLLVSHLAILPLVMGIVWEYYCLSKRFLSAKWIPFALLLLMLEPTFVTQSILMGHDLFLVYFFLLAVNAFLSGKKIFYAVALCLLAIHNIKGIPAAISLMIFYFFHSYFIARRKIAATDILIHVIPLLIWIVWLFLHKRYAGWYLFTPVNDHGNGFNFNVFGIKRIFLDIWQILDFGRVFLWSFIVIAGFFTWKKYQSIQYKTLVALLFLPLTISVLFFSLMDVSLCHRYKMVFFLLANILLCFIIQQISIKNNVKYLLCVVFSIGLITGNFWIYGGGFSNGWDASLKVLPYFKLKKEIDDFVRMQKMSPVEIGTKFPLTQDSKYTHLANESFHFTDIENNSIEDSKYILLSNVSNLFTVEEKGKINAEWILLQESSRGKVSLRLFKNPKMK